MEDSDHAAALEVAVPQETSDAKTVDHVHEWLQTEANHS